MGGIPRENRKNKTALRILQRGAALFSAQNALKLLNSFLNLGGFADSVAQIIELGSAHAAAAGNLNPVNLRRMEGERAFYSYAVGNAPDRESFAGASVSAGNNSPLEGLQSFAGAFNNLNPNLYGISNAKSGNIFALLFGFNGLYNVHLFLSFPHRSSLKACL